MVLHLWLIPAIAIAFVTLVILYEVIRHSGGSGVRTDGRTLLDKPENQDRPRSP